ncbi:alpha/beta hydrolase [bacterium]|nr:alpha/beta hydrolase [bacterium]
MLIKKFNMHGYSNPTGKLRTKRTITKRYVDDFVQKITQSANSPEKQVEGINLSLLCRTEEISLPNKNNNLKSWLIKSTFPSKHYCLFLHGGTSTVPSYQRFYQMLSDKHVNVLAVEYPGYRINKGIEASYPGYTQSAEAAYKYLTEVLKVPPEEITIAGYCIGGYPAEKLAQKYKCKSLFLISPMTKLTEAGKGYMASKNLLENSSVLEKLFQKSLLFKIRLSNYFNTVRNMRTVKSPVYAMASDGDVVFDTKRINKLIDTAKKGSQKVTYLSGFEEGHKFSEEKVDLVTNMIAENIYKIQRDRFGYYRD